MLTAADTLLYIPHIVSSISKDLTPHQLTCCIRVCKRWQASFQRELVRRDNIDLYSHESYIFISGSIQCHLVSRNPSRTLSRDQIQGLNRDTFIKLQGQNLLEKDINEKLQNEKDENKELAGELNYLTITDDDPDGMKNFRRRYLAKKIHRSAFRMRKRMSQVCWPVVTLNIDTEEWAYATNVKFAPGESWLSRFLFCLPPTIQSLVLKLPWDSRTQEDENNDLSSKPQFEHRDHQSLTSLTVDATHISNNFPPLQWFLDHCCPNLLQFSYIAMPGHGGLCPLQFDGCPRLEELTLKGTAKGVAIEAMVGSAAPLKRLTLLQTEAKSSWGLFPAIERHFATLEFLHLDDAPASSREIQSILVNCSNLKTFISIPSSSMGSDSSLHVGDIDPFKAPWQCLGLKKLKIQFTDVERTCSPQRHRRPDTLVDPASSTSLTPLSPQETLWLSYQDSSPEAIDTYYQLSQLTELETLDISTWALSPLRLDAIRTRTQDAPSGIKSLRDVDFSIRSGLNLLSPLKQLKHLEFPPSQFGGGHPWNAKIKKDEVEWMCNNWPQLQIFKCNLGHCAAPDFGEGEKAEYWRWWANQQPELRISLSHFE